VFREVLGRSGLLIDPADPIGAAETIAALVAEPGWQAHYAAQSAANLARWNAAAAADRDDVIALIAHLAGTAEMAPC
jgi:uncharacterized protein YciW